MFLDNQKIYDFAEDTAPALGVNDFDTGDSDFDRMLQLGSFSSGATDDTWVDFDDVYVNYTRARVELCEQATFSESTKCELQEAAVWGDSQVQIKKLNQGAFPSGSQAYLYVIDKNGVVNSSGYPIEIGDSGNGGADTINPTVQITSPTLAASYSTDQATLSLSGTASDNIGVSSVAWLCTSGCTASSAATGTGNWSTSLINLVEGANVIQVTAVDDAGNQATDQITVTYTPALPTDEICGNGIDEDGDGYKKD